MLINPAHHEIKFFHSELNPFIEKLERHPLYCPKPEQIFESYHHRPVIVDLGCGNGHFLESYLFRHPEFVGVGIDRRFKRLYKTACKLEPDRGRVCFWDVNDFCAKAPESFFEEVWMQFPDPWPKKKHTKHRMLKHSLFEDIYRILKPQGRFCFISDCEEYFEFLMERASASKLYPLTRFQRGDLFAEGPMTLFKKKMLENQVPIYSAEFRKFEKS